MAADRALRSNVPVIGFKYGDLWEWEEFEHSRLLKLNFGFNGLRWVARRAGRWSSEKGCGRKESS